MKTKIFTLLIVAFMVSSSLLAQNNVVKLRALRLGARQLSLEYERVLIPRLTANLNFTYQIPWEFGQLEVGTSAPELTGWSVSPAVRFYPNVAKETPRGFYLEGFFKHINYNLGLDYDLDITSILDPNAPAGLFPASSNYQFDGSYKATGGGIALGTHWLVGDVFSIDWKWLGLGVYNTTIGVDIAGNLPYDAAAVVGGVDYNPKWADAESQISAELPSVPGVTLETTSTDGPNGSGSIGVSATSLSFLPRFSLTFGVAF